MRAVTVREYGDTPAAAEIPTPEPGALIGYLQQVTGMPRDGDYTPESD